MKPRSAPQLIMSHSSLFAFAFVIYEKTDQTLADSCCTASPAQVQLEGIRNCSRDYRLSPLLQRLSFTKAKTEEARFTELVLVLALRTLEV
jgi:hypothetical protein